VFGELILTAEGAEERKEIEIAAVLKLEIKNFRFFFRLPLRLCVLCG
jgi:hypothetical protein